MYVASYPRLVRVVDKQPVTFPWFLFDTDMFVAGRHVLVGVLDIRDAPRSAIHPCTPLHVAQSLVRAKWPLFRPNTVPTCRRYIANNYCGTPDRLLFNFVPAEGHVLLAGPTFPKQWQSWHEPCREIAW